MKKITFLILLLTGITLLNSCEKILNPDVVDIPTSTNALQSSQDIDKALAAGYSFLRTVIPDKIFLMGDMRANQFSSYSTTQNAKVETAIPANTAAALLNNGAGDWSGFYKAIAQANLILERIPNIPNYTAELQKKHIGEASFIRAIAYFYLVRFWGDVPINTSSTNLDNIPRSNQKDVFVLIDKDLNIAINNLPTPTSLINPTRATKGAAWAIKAHVAAWNHDYMLTERLCDSVIRFGGFRLIQDTTQLITIFQGKSAEGIFEFNFDPALKEVQKCRLFNRTLGYPWYPDYSDGGTGKDPKYLLTPTREQLDEMFPAHTVDARKYSWFIKEYYKESRPYFGKYKTLQAQGDTTSLNINASNIIITRLADIILLRAEALASDEIGRPNEAINLLNQIRNRSRASDYIGGGNLQDTILLERRKELIGEGQFFFDLVRTRKVDKYTLIKSADWFIKGMWLLPINQSIITQSNNVIVQNPFWL